MSKKVIDINYQLVRVLHPFYSEYDTPEERNHDKYDVVVCQREGIQDQFDYIEGLIHSETKILIDIIQESGNLDDFIEYFDDLTKTHSDTQFYLLVDATFDFEFSKNVKCLKSYKLSILSFFENYGISDHDSIQLLEDFSPYKKENGFVSLNGSLRAHRVILLLLYLKNNILGINGERFTDDEISMLLYMGITDQHEKDFFIEYLEGLKSENAITQNELELLSEFSRVLPLNFHDEDGRRPNLVLKPFYRKILNIVTENVSGFDDSENHRYGTVTFTEKSWKPFKTHQLPIILGLPNSIEKLRELGFDLFDDFIDHSYDQELNHRKRVELGFKELQRLNSIDCVKFYRDNKKRFIKNHSNVYKLKSESYLELQEFMFKNDLV